MRVVQYRILTRILNRVPVPEYIHGFEQGRSIPTMAVKHTGKDVVISIDIKDFFPSIKQNMVNDLFRSIGIDIKPARILSELCTYKAFVPQGSLTAPKLSNIVAATTFGKDIKEFCDKNDITLTIYADDITMSYNQRKDKAGNITGKEFAQSLIHYVQETLAKYNFRINHAKTKIMLTNTRQWVCGAVVNEKVNMMRRERHNLRALVYNCTKNGIEAEAAKNNIGAEAFIRKYAGRINWLCQLNMDAGAKLKIAFRKVSEPYLKKHPDIDIPELAWNSTIEIQHIPSPEDEMIFPGKTETPVKFESESEAPF